MQKINNHGSKYFLNVAIHITLAHLIAYQYFFDLYEK